MALPPHDSWATRFLNAIPPMSDRFMALWLLGLVLGLGILLGVAVCVYCCAPPFPPLPGAR